MFIMAGQEDVVSAWLQNPYLPGCWYSQGLPAGQQVIKPHQLSGLRFMWDCLVKEHHDSSSAGDDPAAAHNSAAAAAASGPGGSGEDSDFVEEPAAAGRGKGKKQRKKRGARAAADDDAGGCILAHSMGLGKSFQTVALLWLFFQQL
jgi:SNF2 family DNA or RNA helicase